MSSVTLGVLHGDITGNGAVTASDIGTAKTQSGQPVTDGNFRNDVTANGSITASDLGQVKNQSGADASRRARRRGERAIYSLGRRARRDVRRRNT